jgi:GDP-L-fucose synthase
MPTNLYGPGDNYHPENSHVIPGLIYRFHYAKVNKLSNVKIWGTGKPRREFLYVDDMARASVHIMNLDKKKYSEYVSPMCSHINVGSGQEFSISELVEIIKDVVGYNGNIIFDTEKPDGNLRKLLDSQRILKLGFKFKISLKDGITKTYKNFIQS